ncbi:Uncharacterised protein [Serratia entomophila]|nr:Uncharacterised protein [Serratia entomophila]CAI2928046.1 Uncharacterised protein [Serratia entomophila]
MKLTRLDRARGRRRGPLQPTPSPNQPVGCANSPPSVTAHHGRLRQASLPVSPETAVHGGFAYAPLLRSASSRAPNTLLISLFSLSLIRLSQMGGQVAPWRQIRVLTLGAHRRLPSKTALSGATGQGRPVEARLTGTFVVADPPDNAGAARVSAQRTDGVKRRRGWRGRAFGPSNCRSLR